MVGGRSSERERLPPFYSGADLHNDQRLSCLSKVFSAICIIFCRARDGGKGGLVDRRERERRNEIERWRGGGHSYSPFSTFCCEEIESESMKASECETTCMERSWSASL
ncbi:hypothetical protein DBV15_04680 [Temnothorax longispinosus]|uniref:Uncharacterized protein n=1 Tax=Temnothorax longispinosus TaxID=300112 RepID=A0A4S2JMU9_9HYME|nr:hypothetical protein DBV15_04680 [Temnothorax longispinosus]